jgi:hypothetical protein
LTPASIVDNIPLLTVHLAFHCYTGRQKYLHVLEDTFKFKHVFSRELFRKVITIEAPAFIITYTKNPRKNLENME